MVIVKYNILDLAELILGAKVAIELAKEKPNMDLITETVISLNALHYKRLGYSIKFKKVKA